MKYEIQLEIDQPLDLVIAKFTNMEERVYWQKGFVECQLIQGETLESGAVSTLIFDLEQGRMEMKEVILSNRLPDCIVARYEMNQVKNISKDSFSAIEENRTIYVSRQEFLFETIFMKIISLFMKRMFVQQTKDTMHAFKVFVEQTQKEKMGIKPKSKE